MKKSLASTLAAGLLLAASGANAQAPVITKIAAEKGKTVVVSGKLQDGKPLANLDWAAKSSVACFPATQNLLFNGNHVFFTAELPTRSEMYITVIPKDPKVNMSGYAYAIGAGKTTLPTELASVVSCEAEQKWDRPKRGKTQDHTRVLPRVTAIQNPYTVIIGVTSPKEVTAGDFDLKVEIK